MSRVLRIMHDDTEMHGAQYDMLAEKLALLDGSVDVSDLPSE